MKKFRDLKEGATFEFDHTGLPVGSGIARGPWIKTGKRTYVDACGHYAGTHRVGTINVKTVVHKGPVEDCSSFHPHVHGPKKRRRR